MESGSLFNSGFLGSSFNWWVGQIADDSTWRDNILPGKFENKDQIPGWGRRYKVRIIGLHDKEEESLASDQLPWAQVMYPVTAGGGQGGASQTPNLMQGNFVFGFFLDGQDQQVPVIMGVLGNNAQTPLSTKIGNNDSNFAGTSGFAEGKEPHSGTSKPTVPDDRLVINKPTPPGTPSALLKPGVKLDKFGRDPSRIPTRAELNAAQSARAEADRLGETGAVREARIAKATVAATKQEAASAASPVSPSVSGATIENSDSVHMQSNADTKRLDLYLKKTVMLNPCDLPGSAMKGMQTEIDNLTREIDKILHAAISYVDAASQILSDIAALIANFACIIAKYMKIIFNKIFEYILKQINKAMSPTVDLIYPNQRNQYLDIKDKITELIKCLYSKITGNLCGQIEGFLNDILDTENPSPCNSAPFVPICAVETLTGNMIALNMNDMNNTIDEVLNGVNTFLTDIQGGLAIVGAIGSGGISGVIGQISGSITSALSFENITLNLFGCDLKPNCAASDYYTLQNGNGAVEEAQQPRPGEVNKAAQTPTNIQPAPQVPFAPPRKDTSDASTQAELDARTAGIA